MKTDENILISVTVTILDGFSCMDCQIKVSWYLLMDGRLTSQFIVNTNNNNHMMTTVTCNDAPNIDFTWKLCWLWQPSRAMTLRTLILREIMLTNGNRHVLWHCEHWFYVKLCWLSQLLNDYMTYRYTYIPYNYIAFVVKWISCFTTCSWDENKRVSWLLVK